MNLNLSTRWGARLAAPALLLSSILAACGGSAEPARPAGAAGSGPSAKAMAMAQDNASSLDDPAASAAAASKNVSPQVALDWNVLALDTVRTLALSDAQAARSYAMLNAALYDAVNGIESQAGIKRNPALVPIAGAPKHGDIIAAAAAAACAVMTQLYPARAALYQARLDADLAAIQGGQAKTDGVSWGTSVGNAVVALRQNDGSSPNESQPGGTGIGVFRATWSGVQFRHLAPFAVADSSAYSTASPPPIASAAYATAFNDSKAVGNAANVDASALETFQFWNDPAGTAQPPAEWIKVASQLSEQRSLSLAEAARLLALVGMAMSDAVAPTYTLKFRHQAWRPTTAIREADSAANPDIMAFPGWTSRAGSTGGTPEFVSGHSSFAGVATTVLRGYFCDDNLPFTLQTDSAPNGARSYSSFTQAETEAGRSRVLGGLHFEFSNQAGLAAGRGVGAEVLATALLRSNGATHHGSCPK